MSQLFVKGGQCVSNGSVFTADILVDEDKIVAIGQNLRASADEVIDARGLLVLPGGVDMHVHLPWPTGDTISADTIESGTRAAAFGGVTTVIDFAIPGQDESLSSRLESKLAEARQNAWVDYSFHINIRGEVSSKLAEIAELVVAGFPSFKVFLAYEGFRLEDYDLLRVLEAVGKANGQVTAHAENGFLADYITRSLIENGHTTAENYAFARPAICEEEAIQRLLAYQFHFGTRLHIHHISTEAGASMVGKAARAGRRVTGETCPHYLIFTDQDFTGDPLMAAALVCAPAIKTKSDQEALWKALANGTLNVLGTDHCPYTREQKEQHLDDFSRIPGGIAGVETRLPLIYTAGVCQGRLSVERFVQVWAEGPARAAGLYPRKGTISIGSDADLVIFDPSANWVLRSKDLHMNSNCLPYEGWNVTGRALITVLRGRLLVQDSQLQLTTPLGALTSRHFV